MKNEHEKLIRKLKKIFNVKTQVALSERLDIDQTEVCRWKKDGFPKGTCSIIKNLINEIEKYNNKKQLN
jgi:hypothetical protein